MLSSGWSERSERNPGIGKNNISEPRRGTRRTDRYPDGCKPRVVKPWLQTCTPPTCRHRFQRGSILFSLFRWFRSPCSLHHRLLVLSPLRAFKFRSLLELSPALRALVFHSLRSHSSPPQTPIYRDVDLSEDPFYKFTIAHETGWVQRMRPYSKTMTDSAQTAKL